MIFPRQGWDLNSVLEFMVLVKILQPCGISVPPSVSLNLGMSGEMDPGPLLVLRRVLDVAIFGLERVERGFTSLPNLSFL